VAFKQAHLHYFVVVAEEGQVTRAAEKLHIAQPALSQAVAHLEADLGFKLFERHSRGVTLTAAGEVFFVKARAALAAAGEASLVAEALARSDEAAIVLGFLGLPPTETNPDLLKLMSADEPGLDIRLHELPFPSLPTRTWLQQVDAAICSQPAADDDVSCQALSLEPRTVLLPASHPLATRDTLTAAEILDETFLGFDPTVDPTWAGFWSLDDVRGEPPARVVSEGVTTAGQRFAALTTARGIATAPACHAAVIARALPSVVAIPVCDVEPAVLTLVARKDRNSSFVRKLFACARRVSASVVGERIATADEPSPPGPPSGRELERGR